MQSFGESCGLRRHECLAVLAECARHCFEQHPRIDHQNRSHYPEQFGNLQFWRVSDKVGNTHNNWAELIEPIPEDTPKCEKTAKRSGPGDLKRMQTDYFRWQLEPAQEREATTARNAKLRASRLELVHRESDFRQAMFALRSTEIACHAMNYLCLVAQVSAMAMALILRKVHDIAYPEAKMAPVFESIESIADMGKLLHVEVIEKVDPGLTVWKMVAFVNEYRNRDIIRTEERQARRDANDMERELHNYYRFWEDEKGYEAIFDTLDKVSKCFDTEYELCQSTEELIKAAAAHTEQTRMEREELRRADREALNALIAA